MSENSVFKVDDLNFTQLFRANEPTTIFYGFEIPAFQRPYQWGEEEVQTLLNDIEEFVKEKERYKKSQEEKEIAGGSSANNDSDDELDDNSVTQDYFLGSLIIGDFNKEKNARLKIVDGAQRLTTITLLIKELKDKLDPLASYLNGQKGNEVFDIVSKELGNHEDNLARIIWRVGKEGYSYLDQDKPLLVSKIRENSNSEILERILTWKKIDNESDLFNTADIEGYNPNNCKYKSNTEIIRKWLDNFLMKEELYELINEKGVEDNTTVEDDQVDKITERESDKTEKNDKIIKKFNDINYRISTLLNNIRVIVITTGNLNQSMKIFETINNTGIALTQMDLHKERFFSNLPNEKHEEFGKKWERLIAVNNLFKTSPGISKSLAKNGISDKLFLAHLLYQQAKDNDSNVNNIKEEVFYSKNISYAEIEKAEKNYPADKNLYIVPEDKNKKGERINQFDPIAFVDRLIYISEFFAYLYNIRVRLPKDKDTWNVNHELLSDIRDKFSYLDYKEGNISINMLLDMLLNYDIEVHYVLIVYLLKNRINEQYEDSVFQSGFKGFLEKYVGALLLRFGLEIEVKPFCRNISKTIIKSELDDVNMFKSLSWKIYSEEGTNRVKLDLVRDVIAKNLKAIGSLSTNKKKLINNMLAYYLYQSGFQNDVLPLELDIEHIFALRTNVKKSTNTVEALNVTVINSIGNLILFDRSLNKSAKNNLPKDKVKFYKKSDLMTVKLLADYLEKDQNNWDEKDIDERTKYIINFVISTIGNKNKSEYLNLEEIKKPEKSFQF